MKSSVFHYLQLQAIALFVSCIAVDRLAIADQGIDFFESKIRPILVEHCYECHSADSKEIGGSLLLDSKPGMLAGGDSGAAIDLSSPGASLLLKAIRHQELQMPPQRKLPNEVALQFEQWLEMGAPDPRIEAVAKPKALSVDWEAAKRHWAFQPRAKVSGPTPSSTDESGMVPIDRFVAKKREEQGLHSLGPASDANWLRRVYVDLIGIPPNLSEQAAFEADTHTDRYNRVVDRLLNSPLYGQRWARLWLDLARYADSNGADENHGYPNAWRYRNYVIDAFNADMPYNQFLMEQLAGDLLPAPTESDQSRQLTATGFLVIGPKMLAEQDKPKLVSDIIDEQIDTVGKVFLGLTLGCARCHDHKFDPILATDYYSMAGIFQSTRSMEHLNHVAQWNEREIPDQAQRNRIVQHTEQLQQAKQLYASQDRQFKLQSLDKQLQALVSVMRGQGIDPSASEEQRTLMAAAEKKWSERLAATSNAPEQPRWNYAWQELYKCEDNQFESEASRVWNSLQQEPFKSAAILELLATQPVPTSRTALIENYSKSLKIAFEQILDATRNKEGAIESATLAKLYESLFAGDAMFAFPEKPEAFVPASDRDAFLALKESIPKLEKEMPQPSRAMAVQDSDVKLVALNIRGNHLKTSGLPLQRDVPTLFKPAADKSVLQIPEKQSGRLELAQWLADPSHPLTTRVIVNRIWQGHFGTGLVSSSSNFGLRGQLPTHPELLDWLANEFVTNGWSIKWLHKQIVLSETYQQSSKNDEHMSVKDPENRWLWRQNIRRMDAETIRDSLLSVANMLNTEHSNGALNATAITDPNVDGANNIGNQHRAIYLEVNRAALSDFLSTFDYVEPGVSVERRTTTIVPHQSLFFMNHPLPQEIGSQLAKQVHRSCSNDADRLRLVTKTLFCREPEDREVDFVKSYLSADRSTTASNVRFNEMDSGLDRWTQVCRAMLQTSEFIYVE